MEKREYHSKEQEQENLSVFGIHAVEELITNNRNSIDKIYFTDKEKKGPLFMLMKEVKKKKINYANIPEKKLDTMAGGRGRHQGVVAFRTIRPYDTEQLLWQILRKKENSLLLLPSSLEDPGNFGAIIRSATAFGADAILLERKGTVPLNGTVAKTSAGMVEKMALIKPTNLEVVLDELKEKGFTIIGADGEGEQSLISADFSGPTLIITGGEHSGIPPYLHKRCDHIVSIPMAEGVESLNVSVAAGVIMYEALRQR